MKFGGIVAHGLESVPHARSSKASFGSVNDDTIGVGYIEGVHARRKEFGQWTHVWQAFGI